MEEPLCSALLSSTRGMMDTLTHVILSCLLIHNIQVTPSACTVSSESNLSGFCVYFGSHFILPVSPPDVGTLQSNGSEFDSSRRRGQPFETPIGVGRVIQGWDQGVPQLSIGQKARLM